MKTRFVADCAMAVTIVSLAGCSPSAPTKEWLGFYPEALVSETNKEGGFGGLSYILWESKLEGTFQIKEIKKFAESNRWAVVSEESFRSSEVSRWKTRGGTNVFPLGYDGFFAYTNMADSMYEQFPRAIESDCVMLKFDTHWIIAISGTNDPAHAYALVSKDGRKMALYHLWGE